MKTIAVKGLTAAYLDEGEGPPVLLAHCSSGNHRMWSALIRTLSAGNRVLAPDLFGYGRSAPWPAGRPFEPDADARLIAAVAERAGGPVHLVGHSYGGAMAVEAARMLGPGAVSGVTLIEPVMFHLLRAGGREAERAEVTQVADATIAAVARGDLKAASAIYMGFWMGRLRWWMAPRKIKASVRETVEKVAMEFAGLQSQEVDDLAAYRALAMPALLIHGARTRQPAKAAVAVLAGAMPNARVSVIPRAGHMSPFTHRDTVNAAIAEHIRETRGGA